jgi:hypothetical protein
MNGNDEGEPRPERARISAEALDRVVVALRYDLYAGDDDEDEKDKQENDEDIEAEHRTLPSGVVAMVLVSSLVRQPSSG